MSTLHLVYQAIPVECQTAVLLCESGAIINHCALWDFGVEVLTLFRNSDALVFWNPQMIEALYGLASFWLCGFTIKSPWVSACVSVIQF